jgi:protein translocase SecG subunit
VRRRRSTTSSGRRPGWRRFSSEPLEVREPDLDERANRLLEPRLARDRERLLVRRTNLLRRDPLLQPVVARDEELLDPLACVGIGHRESLAPLLPCRAMSIPWLQLSAVFQVLLSAFVIVLVLMHSGREAGMGGLGFTPHSQGGTHIVERNLTRLTVVVASVFGLNTIVLFHLL